MDDDVVIMYTPITKPIARSNLKVNLADTYNRRSLPSSHEHNINEIWNARVRQNATLWNGTKFRLDSVVDDAESATFNLGITSYKDFIGTNWSPDAELYRRLGTTDFDNTQAYMSDALGVGSLLETADDQVVFLKRSENCAEAPGLWDIPGGHPEPRVLNR